MITVLIADDHTVTRRGVCQILAEDPGIQVVHDVAAAEEVLPRLRQQPCTVALLDITMPGRSGFDLLQDIRTEFPGVAVLFLSMHPEQQYAIRVLQAGAAGYIPKDSPPDELLKAVRAVAAGGRYITHSLAQLLAGRLYLGAAPAPHTALSNREMEILRLLGSGKSPAAIAETLSLSVKTVGTYRLRILEKLHLSTTAELVHYAVSHSLVK